MSGRPVDAAPHGAPVWHHATCVLVGEAGVLIRGPSGSGKSTLARSLLARVALSNGFAALVGDDRVAIRVAGGRLVATGHPRLAGRIEIRGVGLVACRHERAAVLRLVVECGGEAPRLPDADDLHVLLAGIRLPRHVARGHGMDEAELILCRLRGGSVTPLSVP